MNDAPVVTFVCGRCGGELNGRRNVHNSWIIDPCEYCETKKSEDQSVKDWLDEPMDINTLLGIGQR